MQNITNFFLRQSSIFSQIPQPVKIQMNHLMFILSYHQMVLLKLAPFGDKILWGDDMPDYRKMYSVLFNGITDAIEQLQRIQMMVEELYIDSEKNPITILRKNGLDEENRLKSSRDRSMAVHDPSNNKAL